MSIPWVEKYRPKGKSDLIGNEIAINSIFTFLQKWDKRKSRPGILLLGPPGCGKTSSVYAIANELNFEVIEVNASDARNKKSINKSLGIAAKTSNFFDPKPRILLMEEIDGLAGNKDRGGLKELIRIMKSSNYPIICTANDSESNHVMTIAKELRLIKFLRVDELDIFELLENIADKEDVIVADEEIEILVENASGDIRAALNDLESLSMGNKDVLEKRNRKRTLVELLNALFASKTKKAAREALSDAPSNYSYLLAHIFDLTYDQCKTPEEIVAAYSQIANADLAYRRIMSKQNWKLLYYFFEHLGPGLFLARPSNFHKKIGSLSPYPQSSKYIGMRNRKIKSLKSIAPLFSQKLHISQKNFINIDYKILLKILNSKNGAEIAASMDLNDATIKIIAGKGNTKYLLSNIETARDKIQQIRLKSSIGTSEDDDAEDFLMQYYDKNEIIESESMGEDMEGEDKEKESDDNDVTYKQTSLDDFF